MQPERATTHNDKDDTQDGREDKSSDKSHDKGDEKNDGRCDTLELEGRFHLVLEPAIEISKCPLPSLACMTRRLCWISKNYAYTMKPVPISETMVPTPNSAVGHQPLPRSSTKSMSGHSLAKAPVAPMKSMMAPSKLTPKPTTKPAPSALLEIWLVWPRQHRLTCPESH